MNGSVNELYIAKAVSETILQDLRFNDCWDFPVARYRKVKASRQAAEIGS